MSNYAQNSGHSTCQGYKIMSEGKQRYKFISLNFFLFDMNLYRPFLICLCFKDTSCHMVEDLSLVRKLLQKSEFQKLTKGHTEKLQ